MRVAFVSEVFLPAIDGVVTRLTRTIEELGRAGDEVLMIAPAGGPSNYAGAEVLGVRALPVPLYPDGNGYPPKRVSLPGPSLARALDRYRPDVVHAINPVLLAAGGVVLAHRRRLPLVASYHAHLPDYAHLYRIGFMEPAGWRYVRRLHNLAQINLCTSQATLRELREHGIERLALWPYGIEAGRFDPALASERWRARLTGGHPERLVLLYVGRLAREKTVERLLEAVRGSDGISLAIVGDGPLRAGLEREFAGTPTTFLGFLDGKELTEAYASADVFVLPSQTETLGMVTLEAHASGLPVIAADSPAARELVRHGVDGLRYDPLAPGALSRAVAVLRADSARRARMGRAGRAAVSGASWRQATATLRSCYAAAGRGGGSRTPEEIAALPTSTAEAVELPDRSRIVA